MNKQKLEELFEEIDPEGASLSRSHRERIHKLFSKLEENLKGQVDFTVKEIQQIKEMLKQFASIKDISSMKDSFNERFSSLESSHSGLSGSFYAFKDFYNKLRKKDKDEFTDMLTKEIESQKNTHDEKLKELAISLKRVGFGGGSIPLIPTVEIPIEAANGTNLVFTARHKPLFVESGSGQLMVSQIDDSVNFGYNLSGASPWTVTFVNPPTQTPHFFYV